MTTALRHALELASRNVVLKRSLPQRFGGGGLFVSPGSALRYWYSNLEKVDPTLLQAACEMLAAGDVVWDVGCNVGLFAFAAAGLAGAKGSVIALEPDPWLADLV